MSDEVPSARPPEPWFYQSPYRERLYPAARVLRNATLITGYYMGILWLILVPAAVLLRSTNPTLGEPIWMQYGRALLGAMGGLVLGVLVGGYYLWRFPWKKRGAWVLFLLVTGLGGLVGLGYTLGAGLGGEVALLFCALGLAGYWYVENLPQE